MKLGIVSYTCSLRTLEDLKVGGSWVWSLSGLYRNPVSKKNTYIRKEKGKKCIVSRSYLVLRKDELSYSFLCISIGKIYFIVHCLGLFLCLDLLKLYTWIILFENCITLNTRRYFKRNSRNIEYLYFIGS